VNGPRAAAIETLRTTVAALASPDLSTEARAALVALHAEALAVLDRGTARQHRLTTTALIARLRKLETQLRDREPGERARIIRARMGLTRSHYYELRRAARSPDNCGLASGRLDV
jgi:hypothetical protein